MTSPWTITEGEGPLVATSIHSGHGVRDEIAPLFALDGDGRLREEDPFTDQWTVIAPTRVVGHRSRFEVDLNRPRPKAVYRVPEDAWGLHVWKQDLPAEIIERSLAQHDAFYSEMRRLLDGIVAKHGRFVVLDIHSYNHRREGPDSHPADPSDNPEIIVGTSNMDRVFWAPVVDRFIADLHSQSVMGHQPDVRENVKFRGGNMSQWINATWPRVGCSLAIEFRKDFMDEWTGEPNHEWIGSLRDALAATVPGVLNALGSL